MGGGESLIWIATTGGYMVSAATAYRVQYIKTFKRYKKWQAQHPDRVAKLDYDVGYDFVKKARANCTYADYFHDTDVMEMRPVWMLLWPVHVLASGVLRFLRPEVKVADIPKIQNLQKELGIYND